MVPADGILDSWGKPDSEPLPQSHVIRETRDGTKPNADCLKATDLISGPKSTCFSLLIPSHPKSCLFILYRIMCNHPFLSRPIAPALVRHSMPRLLYLVTLQCIQFVFLSISQIHRLVEVLSSLAVEIISSSAWNPNHSVFIPSMHHLISTVLPSSAWNPEFRSEWISCPVPLLVQFCLPKGHFSHTCLATYIPSFKTLPKIFFQQKVF